jgi:hypothetical protein
LTMSFSSVFCTTQVGRWRNDTPSAEKGDQCTALAFGMPLIIHPSRFRPRQTPRSMAFRKTPIALRVNASRAATFPSRGQARCVLI